jgi:TonB-dependent SusC/RagA subfamily outer membrane receptor
MDRSPNAVKYYLSAILKLMLCAVCISLTNHSFAYKSLDNKIAPLRQKQADSTMFNVTGKVTDESGQPLPGATVFISNSKWAANTNSEGLFKINGLPPGNYEVLVRMIGFEIPTKRFSIINASVNINFTLKTDAITLNQANVTAKMGGNRARYLKMFTDAFLGQTDNAQKSRILNADVLKFNYDEAAGTLAASSTDFIKIANSGLGYDVNFLLNSFFVGHDGQAYGYGGKVYFQDIKGDEKKQKEWARNRSAAYYGSMQHFMRSLYFGITEEEGFKVYKIADSELTQSSNYGAFGPAGGRSRGGNIIRTNSSRVNLKPFKPDSLVQIASMSKVLKMPLLVNNGDTTRFYICYMAGNEPLAFVNSGMHIDFPVTNAQISSVYQIAPGNVILNKDGSLSPEQGLMTFGYWAWPRVAELLPSELEWKSKSGSAGALAKQADPLSVPGVVEKIHVQLDRPWYLAGDTVWMKVYVVDANNKPSVNSQVCFVDLIDAQKRIVKSLHLPMDDGIAWGEMALSDSLIKAGTYVIRAYTNNTEKNNNPFFYKTILLADLNPVTKAKNGAGLTQQPGLVTDNMTAQFFPEGGVLVTDVDSRVALMITASGKPVSNTAGYIANEVGSHIAKFTTNKGGIGTFNLKPLKQGKYWAVITLPNGQERRSAIPQAQQTGIVMAVKQNNGDIVVYLKPGNLNVPTPANLIVRSNNRLQYQRDKLVPPTGDSIVISKAELPEGMLQISLYTAEKILIAERMIYNQDKTKHLKIGLSAGKTVYRPHDKVDLNIAVTDDKGNPVSGNFSVAVNNEADVRNDVSRKTIFTAMHMPGYESALLKEHDLTALTPDQQREIDDMLLAVNVKQPNTNIAPGKQLIIQTDSAFSTLTGQITTPKGKPAPAVIVGLFFQAGGQVLTATTDSKGRFIFNDVPGKRGDPFFISVQDKNMDMVVTVDKYEPPVVAGDMLTVAGDLNPELEYIAQRIAELKGADILGTELKEVTITDTKKVDPTLKDQLLQDSKKYYIGVNADQVLTFMDMISCRNFPTLGGCLLLKVHGVFQRGRTTDSLVFGRTPEGVIAVYVDGIKRPDALGSLTPGDVASVQVLKGPSASIYGFDGNYGALVITTKRGGYDYTGLEREAVGAVGPKIQPLRRYRFDNGFNEAKAFYAPDYSQPQPKTIDNWRPTIYWNPNVTTGPDGTANLSYFTNAAPGTYRVTIEGIDGTGKIAREVFKYTVSE